MIILSTTSEVLRIKLAGAVTTNELYCIASFRDNTDPDILPDSNMVRSNGATAVTLAGSPASGAKRLVEDMHIFNGDTASAAVTIEKYDGTNAYPIFIATLGVGEKIEFQSANGFKVITNSGAVKTSLNQGTSPVTSGDSVVVLSSDVANAEAVANTLVEIPGLAFPVVAGNRYDFEFKITYTAAATSTGSRWVLNGPAFTFLAIYSDYSLAATTRTDNNVTGYNLPAACNTGSGATAGNIAFIRGTITPSASGDVTPWFASEITVSEIRAKAGSTCRYRQTL
jgi:hypothetical protein